MHPMQKQGKTISLKIAIELASVAIECDLLCFHVDRVELSVRNAMQQAL